MRDHPCYLLPPSKPLENYLALLARPMLPGSEHFLILIAMFDRLFCKWAKSKLERHRNESSSILLVDGHSIFLAQVDLSTDISSYCLEVMTRFQISKLVVPP